MADPESRRPRLVEIFERAPIVATTGMTLRCDDEGRAVVELPPAPGFEHGLGGYHGGVLGILLDAAGWFALVPHYEGRLVTVEYQVRLLEPVGGETLVTVGEPVRVGARIGVAEMRTSTADGRAGGGGRRGDLRAGAVARPSDPLTANRAFRPPTLRIDKTRRPPAANLRSRGAASDGGARNGWRASRGRDTVGGPAPPPVRREKMAIVPVHMGSPRFTTVELDGFRVMEAWFPPGEVLRRHVHDRTVFAVMLEGSFEDRMGRRAYDCGPSTVFTEPAGEPHENRIERAGAHVLVVQPDPRRAEELRPVSAALDRIHHFRHGGIAGLAREVGRELRAADPAAPAQLEALVLEMLATAARPEIPGPAPTPPDWLERARERIHATFRDSPTVAEIAAAAGVHRVHLAREFRAHYHVPIGTYVRRLRLEWSAAQLVEDRDSITAIALRAGFADQSHFTHAFRKYLGVPPGAYRRRRG